MDFLTKEFLVEPNRFDGPVLVTGAGGCLGAWAMAILARSRVKCVGFDLSDDRCRPILIMGPSEGKALCWETGDISDYSTVRELVRKHGIRAIIHFAGLQVPFCKENPALGARVNVEGTINVLQVAREAGIKRTVYASSIAAHAMPPGGPYLETLYGAYKRTNEYTGYVYWEDWQVPSVCIRPGVVYGLARDQGMTSRTTIAIQAAVCGTEYEVPFSGATSWLYAGEAAAAFIAAVSQEGCGAHFFDLIGASATVASGLKILREISPGAQNSCSGSPLPFPADLDDGPLRRHVPDYPSISLKAGIKMTYRAFRVLDSRSSLPPMPD